MQTETERHFHRDVTEGFAALGRESRYRAQRFAGMVSEAGAVATARQLLGASGTSRGFTILWEIQRLDRSVEAWCLLPWYRGLFDEERLESARQRLKDHGFDVDTFLAAAAQNPPAWTLGLPEPSDGS
ncbi:hypothetical protein [Streptomyces sp. SID3343]|uniref:hypothetical protein n=1 Tax=Streptomyces sp. SID3343 TaxID=2690260 RepID=UPI00136EE51F|nr:hypothetical protein [Streptomyces sp. SID3343]MYV96889.1 hypothetical protein [Streptomyces sp. SID3343]